MTNNVQQGTGEGALIESSNGTIIYNSRAYFQDSKRYIANSLDGGINYENFYTDKILLNDIHIGCHASMIRIPYKQIKNKFGFPVEGEGLTLFCNPHSIQRENMTVHFSFDAGHTWTRAKTVDKGLCAYSSICWNDITQRFYLLYETGLKTPYDLGIMCAEFDIEWLLS